MTNAEILSRARSYIERKGLKCDFYHTEKHGELVASGIIVSNGTDTGVIPLDRLTTEFRDICDKVIKNMGVGENGL